MIVAAGKGLRLRPLTELLPKPALPVRGLPPGIDGFRIVALFDNDSGKVGARSRGGVPVLDIETLPRIARREKARIAILAVPAPAAQKVLDLVGRAGIKAVLNFAPAQLRLRPGIMLKAVDLKIQLENLVFHLSRSEEARR